MRSTAGGPPAGASHAALDPELQRLARAASATGAPPLTELTANQLRDRVRAGNASCAGGPRMYAVDDVTVPAGGHRLAVRSYQPRPEPRRTLVYFHGGGWVSGDLDYSDGVCRFLAAACDCRVLSVDYRLAPEHRYPAAHEDAYTALDWAAGLLPSGGSLGVAGDSAGGNLAAAAALMARDRGGPALSLQLLIYPVLDHDTDRESYRRNAASFPIGEAELSWFWDKYAPDPVQRAVPALSPMRAPDVRALPPTQLVVAGHDPLHDEGVAYAERLHRAGVPVRLLDYPALTHGFLRFTAVAAAARTAQGELVDGALAMFEEAEAARKS